MICYGSAGSISILIVGGVLFDVGSIVDGGLVGRKFGGWTGGTTLAQR